MIKDLTGLKFGLLFVVELVGTNNSRNSLWRVRCDCGDETQVSGSNLQRNHSKSCGCQKKKLLSARRSVNVAMQRFGLLVAMRPSGDKSSSGILWECFCDCGNMVRVAAKSLRCGQTQSCGCYRIFRVRQVCTTHGLSRTKEYARTKVNKRKELKMRLDASWTGTMEKALAAFFRRCVVCGSSKCLSTDHVLSLSRGHGLAPGNAVRLCRRCNSIKGDKFLPELPEAVSAKILTAARKFSAYWDTLKKESYGTGICRKN